MKRILCGILILSLACSLLACGDKNKSDDWNSMGILSGNKNTLESDDFQFLIDEDTTRADVIARFGTDLYAQHGMEDNDCRYEPFEMFGVEGRLSIGFDSDERIRDVVFSYDFPGAINWVQSNDDDHYNPTSEDKRAAQAFMDSARAYLTEEFGAPDFEKKGRLGWDRSDDFFERYIIVEAKERGKEAVEVYYGVR